MTAGAALTDPQRRALQALADGADTPREVARALWPDSPAWNQRTRGRRTGTISGALGGTMPMNAAKILHRLRDRSPMLAGWNDSEWLTGRWYITDAGRAALTDG